jgi:hypothetical protein
MANTVIALKKSSTPSAEPVNLANGELAINFADGKLFYKNSTGQIVSFTSGSNSFGTVNANGTLIISDTVGDVLTIEAGNNISIVGDAINDKITISATGGGVNVAVSTSQIKDLTSNDYVITSVTPVSQIVDSALMSAAFDKANSANIVASSAFDKANSANVLAFNTGIGANAFTSATITGANTAVGAGANAFTSATITGANTAVGAGANAFTSATITGANTAVGTGANTYLLSVIAGANTAVGAGANAFTSATITGANNISIAAFNKANVALPNTSGVSFAGNLNFPTGNVGIGTSSPTTKLNLFGSASGGITTLTDNTSIVIDMTSNNNFAITLGGSNTFINPTTMNPGQSGVIWISQDGTGGRSPSWGSYWRFPSNTAPTLTTTASAVDAIVYVVRNSTSITAQAILNVG